MILGERVKQLRKAKNWSQVELAEKIVSDARQISRYENGKITPSIDALMKLATTFDVSIDYLLIENVSQSKIYCNDEESISYIQQIKELDDEDKKSLKHILDALVKKNKIKEVIDKKN